MKLVSLALAAAEEESTTSTAASPGITGWIFTFVLAIAAAFLIYDMVRRIRKVRYREEIIQEISEEEAALEEARELERERREREEKNK